MKSNSSSQTPNGMSLADAAIFYARQGIPVFPLRPQGKEPLSRHGFKDATVNPDEVTEWWRRTPDANIGIPTGSQTGMVVVDVDGPDGTVSLEDLEAAVVTRTSRTGRGFHLLFQHPGHFVPCVQKIAPGVDVKADRGYIVAPPSLHANGSQYLWDEENDMGWTTPIAPVPRPVIELLIDAKRWMNGNFSLPERVQEGNRNETMFRYGCSLKAKGLSFDAILDALTKANAERCRPPLGERELQGIARGIERYPEGRSPADSAGTTKSPADLPSLTDLAEQGEFFHAPDGTGYVTLHYEDHDETYAVDSRLFRQWLRCEYFAEYGKAPRSQPLQDAVAMLDARARFAGQLREVYVRVGCLEDQILIDLGDPSFRAVQVSASGWQVVPRPRVPFLRTRGMAELFLPKSGGTVEMLCDHLNLSEEEDLTVVVAWLVAALRPRGPFPVLVFEGEQGSSKSTTARALRELIDPARPPLRTLPRNEQDLMIAATNSWILAMDNVSSIPNWLSDSICRLVTGGGLATRELYTNREEALFEAQRPVILNSIGDVLRRDDLRDRALTVTLSPIPDYARRSEAQFWQDYRADAPLILGALLDGVCSALKNSDLIELISSPRMADFAHWATAAEQGLGWQDGRVLAAMDLNREASVAAFVENDDVAAALMEWVPDEPWSGTATQLLWELTEDVGDEVTSRRSWPTTPHTLSRRLAEAAPALRKIGIEIDRHRGTVRTITISRTIQSSVECVGSDGAEGSKRSYVAPDAPDGPFGGSEADRSYDAVERRAIQEEDLTP